MGFFDGFLDSVGKAMGKAAAKSEEIKSFESEYESMGFEKLCGEYNRLNHASGSTIDSQRKAAKNVLEKKAKMKYNAMSLSSLSAEKNRLQASSPANNLCRNIINKVAYDKLYEDYNRKSDKELLSMYKKQSHSMNKEVLYDILKNRHSPLFEEIRK